MAITEHALDFGKLRPTVLKFEGPIEAYEMSLDEQSLEGNRKFTAGQQLPRSPSKCFSVIVQYKYALQLLLVC